MDEIWKDIKGYEGLYMISNLGRIKSLSKQKRSKTQTNYITKEKILKPQIGEYYLHVDLYKDKKDHTKTIHSLVAKAFIPNPNNLPEVNHKDGIKYNNNVTNLEWSTFSDNTKHAYKTGLLVAAKGENHGMSKLTEIQVKEIRELKGKLRQREIADKYNVCRQLISCIHLNKNWKNI